MVADQITPAVKHKFYTLNKSFNLGIITGQWYTSSILSFIACKASSSPCTKKMFDGVVVRPDSQLINSAWSA